MADKIRFENNDGLTIDFDPKKQTGLIQLSKDATLNDVIELMNDLNLVITGDEDLKKKWSKWMPNG